MTQPTKPSAGALRAASEIVHYTGIVLHEPSLAHIIDRETRNPERDRVARQLAEAVIRTAPGPSKKGDPVSILLRLARQILRMY